MIYKEGTTKEKTVDQLLTILHHNGVRNKNNQLYFMPYAIVGNGLWGKIEFLVQFHGFSINEDKRHENQKIQVLNCYDPRMRIYQEYQKM